MSSTNKEIQKKSRRYRLYALAFVLLLTTVLGLLHQQSTGFIPVSIDSPCPFGAIESAFELMINDKNLQRVAASNYILLAATLFIAFLFRRAFCGLICPLGFLQELAGIIRQKTLKKRFTIPSAADLPLRYTKYIVLGLIIYYTYKLSDMVFRPYDPWVAYHHLTSSDLMEEFSFGLIVLIITLVGSFFYDRFFCKYFWPMGAVLAMLSHFGLTRIKRNENTCIGCKACDRVCPVNINVSKGDLITSVECINCNECVNVCPKDSVLTVNGRFDFTIPERHVLGTVVVVFAVLIFSSTAIGDFVWEKPTLESASKSNGGFNAEIIKGSNTLKEVLDLTKIPPDYITKKYPVKKEEFSQQIKTIGSKYGFTTEDLREMVKQYQSEHGTSPVKSDHSDNDRHME